MSNITIGAAARKKIISGIQEVTNVIRQSYGPYGGNVSIEVELYPYHIVANDAQSIIQAVSVEDPIERRGVNFLKELSDKASKDSGEGRKTTIILAEEILQTGAEKGLEAYCELNEHLLIGLEELDNLSQPIEVKDIQKVAFTSSRDKDTAQWIAKIYSEIGREGLIEVEGSGTYETSYEVTQGVRFRNVPWISPYMASESSRAVYENPIVCVAKRPIDRDSDISAIVDLAVKDNKPLVLFVDRIDVGVASRLVATHRANVAKILVIKAPILWKDMIIEDFAKCTGSTIISEESGITWKAVKREHLGTVGKIVCDSEDTLLMDIQDITEHKNLLLQRKTNDDLIRLQWLNTQSAVLRLGASTEAELSFKLLKARDAINACRLALLEGVVEGGGKTLKLLSERLPNGILKNALLAPYEQLTENAGGIDMDTTEVLDAVIVLKNALRNAVSLAGIVLTTGADIHLPIKSYEDKQLEILTNKQFNV